MKVISSLPIIIKESTYIALGNFDGVHIGHQKLIKEMVKMAKQEGKPSVVFTLDPHPLKILGKKEGIKYISTQETKINNLRNIGVDYLVLYPFNKNLAKLEPELFIKQILIEELKVAHCFVGFNYSFGRGGVGNSENLKSFGEKYNFSVNIVPPVYFENRVVSSTWIRECLKNGQMQLANILLGNPYFIEGEVIQGNQIGRKINFPTANVSINEELIYPSTGVYIVDILVDNKLHRGVANIGYKPTVESQKNKLTIEAHILNFCNNIYGKKMKIYFLDKIRDERKFPSLDSLAQQIKEDSLKALYYK